MTDTTIALDFTDIALDELDNDNEESAAEFIEDAAEIIEDDSELSHIHESLVEAQNYLEDGEREMAYDAVREAWARLGSL